MATPSEARNHSESVTPLRVRLFGPRTAFRRWCWRCAAFLVLWWVLSEGRSTDWGFGFAVAAVAAAFSRPREAGSSFRPSGLLRFGPFFLWHSFLAAVQVARLALSPRLRLRPSMLSYLPRLRTPGAQVFLANTISLLPGTLTADLWEGRLRLHVLNSEPQVLDRVAAVEEQVATLFRDTGREDEDGRV